MVNVTIRDGGPLTPELLENFEKEYIENKVPVKDLKIKYGLGPRTFSELIKDIKKRTGFSRKTASGLRGRPNGKHYRYRESKKRWVVSKTINGKTVYFGSFKTENGAKRMVEELKKINWDVSKKYEIREKVRKEELYGE